MVLSLEHVDLERGGRAVLRDVTISAAAGSITALLGPSGAGKSSVLRCLVRLEEPHAGRVLVDGADVRSLDPCGLRRRVGLVAQAPVMLPGDVRANLTYAAEDLSEAQVRAALDQAELAQAFLARPAAELSGGERARVAIARALVRGPEALLFDEPTAALDPARAAAIAELIRRLAAVGLTIVVTAHDVALVQRLADRAVLLVDGAVVSAGAPAEVVAGWEAEPAWR
ncbi:ABC transporter ATP-binding protein [Capillimicrobium parvum]|uniref:Arginine transport ATP-binding protein ArtM n=1 Tax=Capillimicrobium parvum TaxID=2884022 RepID=A0A9E7BZ94_9ACTN|nr:ABC transporter ATP-binding protein [Capillimicrobium parvum]UGS35100.1 Arginine transport ATP-binding protein ArtM [Capillimicrobium parvum]